jgi:ferredoxin-NADP reductase
VAGTALLERLTWRRSTLEAVRPETATARTLRLTAPGWQGHRPGQHVDVRLTAANGYTAQRAYSIGSPPSPDTLELTVEATPGGEVSPFLARVAKPGVQLEIRGPLGGWFVWSPAQQEPVQLIGGGSGVVPLMSMLRTHRAGRHTAPMRLLYSVRSPGALLYAPELVEYDGRGAADQATVVYSREAPAGDPRSPRRLEGADLAAHALAAAQDPQCYVCGPTPFVEAVIGLLLHAGHAPERIRAERFGAGRTAKT